MSAATGTFSGDLSAVGGTFSGTLDASSISTGTLDVARLANIGSAQIADGAIINAKIGNAQITTAKIDDAQVDTLQIAGNAVTIVAGREKFNNGPYQSSDSWFTYDSFGYGHGDPNTSIPCVIFYTWSVFKGVDDQWAMMRIVRNGAEIFRSPTSYSDGVGQAIVSIPPGYATLYVQFYIRSDYPGNRGGDSHSTVIIGAAR